MIVRYSQVLKVVGKLIYERGLDYYNEKKIDLFEIDGHRIRAEVQGSRKNTYTVIITLNEKDELVSASCTCPYWTHCKHIAAVYIRYFEEKTGNFILAENSLKPAEPNRKEKVFPLRFEQPPSFEISQFLKMIEQEITEVKVDDGKQWRLVFKLKKDISFPGEPVNGFTISPGLQALKKDGTYGSIYNYNKKKIFTCSQAAHELLQKLLFLNTSLIDYSFRNDFAVYLDYFINHVDLPLFLVDRYRTIEIKRHIIRQTAITFSVEEIRSDQVYFSPVISFTSDDDVRSSTENAEFYPVKAGSCFSVISSHGILFYISNEPEYAVFIESLLERKILYTPSDIMFLKTNLEKFPVRNVSVRFESHNVTLLSVPPVPVLDIKESMSSMLFIKIVFDYLGNEHDFSSRDKFILAGIQDNGDIRVIKRIAETEKCIIISIKKFLKQVIIHKNLFHRFSQFSVALSINQFLSDFGQSFLNQGFRLKVGQEKKIIRHNGSFQFGVSSGIDWFDLDIFYVSNDGVKTKIELSLNDIEQGIGKVGDSYIIFNKDDSDKLKNLLLSCHKEKKSFRFSKFDFNIIDTLHNDKATIHNEEMDQMHSVFRKLQDMHQIPNYPLPDSFNATLRHYQVSGYYWLLFLHSTSLNGCLADDMGLGKTVQTLALLQRLKEMNNLGLSLLVVPVTTYANWENEMARFAPSLRCIRHAGSRREKNPSLYSNYDIILTSYHTLRNDIDNFIDHMFDYLILDESQSIKNAFSKTFRAMRVIKAKHKLSLTGTPVENKTLELWSQMDFLNPGILGTHSDFKKNFAVPIEEYKDERASDRLKKIIYPFVLRRKKEEVMDDLPEKEVIYKYVEMNSLQKEAYTEISNYYRVKIKQTIIDKGMQKSSIDIIEALLRLRQMALFPFLVSEKYASINSSKYELFKEMLLEILMEDHKVLVFSQFVQVLKQLEGFVKENRIKYSYIDGSVKLRSKEIDSFQEKAEIQVFLLSLKAGGFGINLTAADYVIIFDPWWNPAIEKQAIDRSHRIGQKQKVTAFKLIVKDSIEEKILVLQKQKEELVNSIVKSEKNFFKTLNEQDVLNLFGN